MTVDEEDKAMIVEKYLRNSKRNAMISAWIEQEFRRQVIEGFLEGWKKEINDHSN